MQIDRSIWGPETEWITNTIDNNVATSLRAALGAYMTHQFGDYLASEMTLNALIDNSINFCAAVEDTRTFYKAHSLVFDDNGDILPLYEDAESINFAWVINPYWYLGNGLGGSISYWANDDKNRWSEWASKSAMESADGCFGFQATPIFKQKLNKIIGFIYVCVSDTDTVEDSIIEITLGDWIANYKTSYPYLRRVFMQLATCTNPGVTSWNGFCHSIDDYFDITLNLECSNAIKSKGSLKSSYGFYGATNRKQQVTIMGMGDGDWSYLDSGHHPIGVDPDDSHYFYSADNDKVAYIREYSEDLIEEIYHQVAFYGIFFTGAYNFNQTFSLTDNDVYCGTIDENGFTHGDYTRGTDNLLQPQMNWEDTEDSPYDPSRPPTPSDNWGDNTPSAFALSSKLLANHWWKMTDADLYYALRHINEVDLENLDYNDTFGLNPIEGVLQLRRVYVNAGIAHNVLTPTSMSQIVIGELSVGIPEATALWYVSENKPLIYTCVEDHWVGEPSTYPNYQDFRAYSPFTSITFYDAFCGVIDVEPEKILNKYITITQTIDLLTGDKITSLYASPTTGSSQRQRVATLQGNCAEEIPINGQAVADYMRNKIMNTHNVISSSFGAIGHVAMGAAGASISAVSGNVIGAGAQALGTVANATSLATSLLTKAHEVSHTIPSIVKISNGTNNVESLVAFPPTLIMYNPKMIETYDESEYGDKTGFAGYKIATLQSCGIGTHVVSHPRVNISGTSAEEYMLIDQLQKGIYVKEES